MKTKAPKIDLRPYYTFGMPLLVLMGSIATGGVILAVLAHFIF